MPYHIALVTVCAGPRIIRHGPSFNGCRKRSKREQKVLVTRCNLLIKFNVIQHVHRKITYTYKITKQHDTNEQFLFFLSFAHNY